MADLEQLKEIQQVVFRAEDMLKATISTNGKITPETIESFDNIISNFEALGDVFFKEFEKEYLKQIVTFGSISTTTEVCRGLRDNLANAHASGQNPIAAKQILDKNYLGFISALLRSLNEIYLSKSISDKDYLLINESVRNLFRLSIEDSLLKPSEIKFHSKESERAFTDTLNESASLTL